MRLVVGPSQTFLDEIRNSADRHEGGTARIAVAWAREAGVLWLLEALDGRIADLQLVVGVNERSTTVEALLRLLPVTSQLWVFFKHARQTFHPKLYLFEGGAAGGASLTFLVGSSNLTPGGLLTNFEASMQLEGDAVQEPAAADLLVSMNATWEAFTTGDFAHLIEDPADVERLYKAGYVITEATTRRERRRQQKNEEHRRDLPTAPPQYFKPPDAPPVAIPFDLEREPAAEEAPPESVDPIGAPPLPDRFFVRTLTPNDVAKLQGQQIGTFEPDLGRSARDTYPGFWGWPDEYNQVVRRLPRQEWEAKARLISRLTPPEGVEVTLMLWYREPRPDHLEEHRMRFGPIGVVREAVPDEFDSSSLVVFERAPTDGPYDYVVRLLTNADPGFADYASYLTETRAGHRFGYGTLSSA